MALLVHALEQNEIPNPLCVLPRSTVRCSIRCSIFSILSRDYDLNIHAAASDALATITGEEPVTVWMS